MQIGIIEMSVEISYSICEALSIIRDYEELDPYVKD